MNLQNTMFVSGAFKLSQQKIIFWLLCYRLLLAVSIIWILPHFVHLSDPFEYMQGFWFVRMTHWFDVLTNPTSFVGFFAYGLWLIGLKSALFPTLGFSIFASIGMVRLIKAMPFKCDYYSLLLIGLLFFPAFNMWTSMPGKEAVVVGMLGLVMAELIASVQGVYHPKAWIVLPGVYFIVLFKPLFVLLLMPLWAYSLLKRRQFYFMIALIGVSIIALVFAWMHKGHVVVAKGVAPFFAHHLRASVDLHFDKAAPFYSIGRMLVYAFIAMWGPLPSELQGHPFLLLVMLESLALFIIWLVLLIHAIIRFGLRHHWLLLYGLIMAFVVEVPYGIYNAGSAIRYRTDIYLLIWSIFLLWRVIGKQRRR